jgi:hypothetical protein
MNAAVSLVFVIDDLPILRPHLNLDISHYHNSWSRRKQNSADRQNSFSWHSFALSMSQLPLTIVAA